MQLILFQKFNLDVKQSVVRRKRAVFDWHSVRRTTKERRRLRATGVRTFHETEKATFRSLCYAEPFWSCTMVPVSHFTAHIYENKIGRVETRIIKEGKRELKATVSAESAHRSGSTTIYGSSGNSVDGFRSSGRNSFGEIGPARQTAERPTPRFSDGQEVNIRSHCRWIGWGKRKSRFLL